MKRTLLKEAAHWYAEFCSDDISRSDIEAWQKWISKSADHAWAWQQVEQLQGKIQRLPTELSMAVWQGNEADRLQQRRRFLKSASALVVSGGVLTALGYSLTSPENYDYTTLTGERREIRLDDGSLVVMNTASAMDVAFSATERHIFLREGEILVSTAADPSPLYRPLVVVTGQGRIRALGARFIVREAEGTTQVSVLEHQVEIQPGRLAAGIVLAADEQSTFSHSTLTPAHPLPSGSDAWQRGMLIVDNWSLKRVLAELARYSRQRLGADASIENFRLSGAFPLDNMTLALKAIAASLPVSIQYRWQFAGSWAETRLVPR